MDLTPRELHESYKAAKAAQQQAGTAEQRYQEALEYAKCEGDLNKHPELEYKAIMGYIEYIRSKLRAFFIPDGPTPQFSDIKPLIDEWRVYEKRLKDWLAWRREVIIKDNKEEGFKFAYVGNFEEDSCVEGEYKHVLIASVKGNPMKDSKVPYFRFSTDERDGHKIETDGLYCETGEEWGKSDEKRARAAAGDKQDMGSQGV